jgi:hypothetical protein
MKQLILNSTFLLLIFISACTYSQNISTEGAQWCTWDNDLELWRDCFVNDTKSSLITINETQTVITQTTEDNRSTYYVVAKEIIINKENQKVWHYTINSDLGQLYEMYINPTDRIVKAIYTKDNVIKGTTFYIKAIY